MKSTTIKQSAGELHLSDICLFVYFCALFAHRTNIGIDTILIRASFILYIVVFLFCDVFADIKRGEKRAIFSSMAVWLIVFWAFAWMSSFWSESIRNTLQTNYITNAIQAIGIVTGITYRIRTKEDLLRLMSLLVLAGLYGALVLYVKTPSSAWGSERVGEAVGLNENTVGLTNALLCLICIFLYHQKRKIWSLVALIPFILIAMFSGSRKGFFVIVVGIVLVESFTHKGFKGFFATLFALVMVFVLCQVIMTVPDFYNVIGYRIERLIGDAGVDGSAVERAWYREYAFGMWLNKPFVGYGFNGFLTQMQEINYYHQAYCHCNQLELLADLGIVGLCLYYGLFLVLIRDFAKSFKRFRKEAAFGIVFLAVIFAVDYGYVSFVGVNTYLFISFIYCLRNTLVSSYAMTGRENQ